jgi:predicted 3-demethylubiquinone-9 3-methyltransferase (glyoxalase superfamily)
MLSSHFGMVTDRFGVSWMIVVMPRLTPDNQPDIARHPTDSSKGEEK